MILQCPGTDRHAKLTCGLCEESGNIQVRTSVKQGNIICCCFFIHRGCNLSFLRYRLCELSKTESLGDLSKQMHRVPASRLIGALLLH